MRANSLAADAVDSVNKGNKNGKPTGVGSLFFEIENRRITAVRKRYPSTCFDFTRRVSLDTV